MTRMRFISGHKRTRYVVQPLPEDGHEHVPVGDLGLVAHAGRRHLHHARQRKPLAAPVYDVEQQPDAHPDGPVQARVVVQEERREPTEDRQHRAQCSGQRKVAAAYAHVERHAIGAIGTRFARIAEGEGELHVMPAW